MVDQGRHERQTVLLMAAVIVICIIAFALSIWLIFLRPDQTDIEPLRIGGETYEVTVADTDQERQQGLSGTKYLADDRAMVFLFDRDDTWNIWMKDMRYPIDIVWVDRDNIVVHVASNVAPESYPERFSPPEPARYVVELAAGQVAASGLRVGDRIDISKLEVV